MKKTNHTVVFDNATNLHNYVEKESVDLIVTSPPYPMIKMWDALFCQQNPRIEECLKNNLAVQAYTLMHEELNKIWAKCYVALKQGGIMCVNIGDAVRAIDKQFALYPNHSETIQSLLNLHFNILPCILWHKQTNAPNKFMGSGMTPTNAYVTLEHEYILVARKGNKRTFKTQEEKANRLESAFFWEERNKWFSDLWVDIKGAPQKIKGNSKTRSGAYPLELAYRLINMYSVKGDVVLDPFLGTGTTSLAAAVSTRNSIGIEKNTDLLSVVLDKISTGDLTKKSEFYKQRRLRDHALFAAKTNRQLKHVNKPYKTSVLTSQEVNIAFDVVEKVLNKNNNAFEVSYF